MADFKNINATLVDDYGWDVENTPQNEMRVVIPTRLCGTAFGGNNFDTNFWSSGGTINSATISQINGQVILSAGTNSSGTVTLTSVRPGRYMSGSANKWRGQIQLSDTGTTNNYRQWGVAIDSGATDGAWFELTGSTMNVVTSVAGVATRVPSASWNVSTTIPTLTNVNAYEIYYNNGKVYFTIGGNIAHTVNANTAPWSSNLTLRCFHKNTNVGNTTNVTLNCRASSIQRLGQLDSETQTYYNPAGANAGTQLKYGAGQLHVVIPGSNVGAINFYDSIGGATTQIAFVDMSKQSGTLEFNIPFFTGLWIVGTGAGVYTIVYE